ncbi:MAG: YeeE/YedE family protein [Chloroflexi bacterium]|nr:YeeE/YedE family protein [Chloroflexota bacterium]
MTETALGGGAIAASTSLNNPKVAAAVRIGLAWLIFSALLALAFSLHETPGRGAAASLSLLIGVALGVIFQRGRFCFFCIMRDFIEHRNSSGMFAILSALAVGGIGYAIVFGAFMPNPSGGGLPPDAHIGPVSWVLVAGGVAFGVGMALSGACISGHLYRLGEGYARAPFALFGSLLGFGVGFFTWHTLYTEAIATAPIAWLPKTLGYGGSLAVHLAALSALACLLLRYLPELPPQAGGKITWQKLYRTVFVTRWNPLVTGALVGLVGVFAYFRVAPLGVTSQLGSLTRTALSSAGLLADHLPGLDALAGCAARAGHAITNNGLLIGGLVAGSLAIALFTNRFRLSRLTLRGALTALLGGALMGWGAMVSLGCTVGTLLSGISAFAISGWVFGGAVFAGVWLGIKLRLPE